MSGNIIHISDLSFFNDKEDNTILSSYKEVLYGGGVIFSAKYYDELDSRKRYDLINLNKIDSDYIAITANKNDCIGNCDNVTSIPVSYRQSSVDIIKKRAKKGKAKDGNGSGIVLLFLYILGNSNKSDPFQVHWNDESATKLKYSKNNVLKSSKQNILIPQESITHSVTKVILVW